MKMHNLLIFILSCLLLIFQNQCQIENKTILGNRDIEFEAMFRIDSLYNNFSLLVKKEDIFFTESFGNGHIFYITSSFYNSYFIINRKEKKRIGIDNENKLHLYKMDDVENIEKTYWNIIKDKNQNYYLIQNVYNQKFLEIKPKNNKLRCKNSIELSLLNNAVAIKNIYKFYFFKLFEEVQLRSIDIEMVNREPIDVFMKYTDYTDKTLKREGINETLKENDMEEIKYSIRSILKYIPWIRKIFIVMPNDKVRFLKPIDEIKDKFIYIKEKDVIGFDTTNSAPLQFNLYKMEEYGISENFIYMDDNYFFGGNLKKTDFFYYDDELKKVVPAIVNNMYVEVKKQDLLNQYNEILNQKDSININDFLAWKFSIISSMKLIADNYNIPLEEVEFTHCAIPLNINDLKEIYTLIKTKYKYANETLLSKEKNIFNLQPQILFSLFGLNIKKRKVNSIEYNHLSLDNLHNDYLYTKMIGVITGGNKYTQFYERGKKILAERYNYPHKYEIDFSDKTQNEIKIIKEKEQSTYINKTELKIIEEIFEKQLTYYIIIYWGLIIIIFSTIIAIIYYCLFKKNNYFF